MHDYLIYIVMGLLVLLAVVIACEKPKDAAANHRRYTLLTVLVAAVVLCLVFALGLMSVLFGGC